MDHAQSSSVYASAEIFFVIDLQAEATFLFAAFLNLAGAFIWLRSRCLFLLVGLNSKLHPTGSKMFKITAEHKQMLLSTAISLKVLTYRVLQESSMSDSQNSSLLRKMAAICILQQSF